MPALSMPALSMPALSMPALSMPALSMPLRSSANPPSMPPIRSTNLWPTTSSRNQPNIASAAGFQSVTTPVSSTPMKPSGEACTVSERIRSARRRPLTSRRVWVMSAVVPVTRTSWLEPSCSARARVCTQRTVPVSSCQRYSRSSSSLPG